MALRRDGLVVPWGPPEMCHVSVKPALTDVSWDATKGGGFLMWLEAIG